MQRTSLIIAILLLAIGCYAGRLERVEMPTHSAMNRRPLMVYLPDAYDRDTLATFPVLYLLHGINGDEKSWIQRGGVVEILDSLNATGAIRPCVVVMPNTNAGKYIWEREDHTALRNIIRYPRVKHGNFAIYFHEIQTYVKAHYRLTEGASECYLAGLSNGACQAADIALYWPENFAAIGLFSPVLGRDQLPVHADDVSHNSDGRLYYPNYCLYIGRGDFFRPSGIRFHRMLRHRHIPCQLIESKGGHNWRNWQHYLCDFLCHFLAPTPDGILFDN